MNTDTKQRKATGSYYTPRPLVDCLLNSALHPLIAERMASDDPERALLALTVCDPACGGGAFLAAAVDRLAHWMAFVRTGDVDPDEDALAAARRDVVSRCMYGVDLNPVAVDLTRAALWVLALRDGSPNPFLDHRIKHGNALLGATPALLARGVPDAAFTPIEGDDPKACAALRRQNAAERTAGHPPQGALF